MGGGLGEDDDGDKKIALTHIALKANGDGDGDGRIMGVVWRMMMAIKNRTHCFFLFFSSLRCALCSAPG